MNMFAAYVIGFICLIHTSPINGWSNPFSSSKRDPCPGVKDMEELRDACLQECPEFQQDVFCGLIKDMGKGLKMTEEEKQEVLAKYAPFIMCLVNQLEILDSEGKIDESKLMEIVTTTATFDPMILPKLIPLLNKCANLVSNNPSKIEEMGKEVLTCLASALDNACDHKFFGKECYA